MTAGCAPVAPFDQVAESYDRIFTESLIGRAQRTSVWRELLRSFSDGQKILEVNCGTGSDALFLAGHGISVDAFDISPRMIGVARQKLRSAGGSLPANFEVLSIEALEQLKGAYDGALSNFGGLNCVRDLRAAAAEFGRLVRPGGSLVLCVASRCCAWETAWYAAQGEFRRAVRRWSGRAEGRLGNSTLIPVFYPTARQIAHTFGPWFSVERRRGIGVLVPPSYLEPFARRAPQLIALAAGADRVLARMPVARALADHTLLVLRRRPA